MTSIDTHTNSTAKTMEKSSEQLPEDKMATENETEAKCSWVKIRQAHTKYMGAAIETKIKLGKFEGNRYM